MGNCLKLDALASFLQLLKGGVVGILIRTAIESDIDFVIEELRNFEKFYGGDMFDGMLDSDYARNFLGFLIKDHVFFLAENEGEQLGFIAAFKSPHKFNPKKKALNELFWWIKESARHTRAGYLLLKKYVELGKTFDQCVMTIEHNSPVKPESINKFGFKFKEMNFVLEKGF